MPHTTDSDRWDSLLRWSSDEVVVHGTSVPWNQVRLVEATEPWPSVTVIGDGGLALHAAPEVPYGQESFSRCVEGLIAAARDRPPTVVLPGWLAFPMLPFRDASPPPEREVTVCRVGRRLSDAIDELVAGSQEEHAIELSPHGLRVDGADAELTRAVRLRGDPSMRIHAREIWITKDAVVARDADRVVQVPLLSLRTRHLDSAFGLAHYVFGRCTRVILSCTGACPAQAELEHRLALG